MLQDYAATTYSTAVITRGQHQTWQVAAFTVGYIQGTCMYVCMHLHEKDTPPHKKKRQFVLR